jgi:phosphoadenosine phosphosulfate reductase
LEFYGHGPPDEAAVWRASKSTHYYINGQTVAAPSSEQLRRDLPAITEYLLAADDYDALDEQLIEGYRESLKGSQTRLAELEYEATNFIQETASEFPEQRYEYLVSFSGGKDSTVVSDLVRRSLGRADILHIFGDTTLEDPNTYAYVHQFQADNPLIPFFLARAEPDFFSLVDEMGPPSRTMRWCCTIFKIGPINEALQTFSQRVLTFYGIRAMESPRRGQYTRITTRRRRGSLVSVTEDDLHGVTTRAKMGQQVTASPILDWSEFDVWLYILSHNLPFNKSYRLGFSRVGCWPCPMNSRWSEILTQLFFPENAARWRSKLLDFARRIGKPDPEEYVDSQAWTKRFGGAGLENRFTGLEVKPCGDTDHTIQLSVGRSVNKGLLEYLKPLGRVNGDLGRSELGETYLEGRRNSDWAGLIVQAIEGADIIRVTALAPEDFNRLTGYIRCQASKFEQCIRCTACAAVCPQGAITVCSDPPIYEIDQNRCTGCLECVTHFDSPGCLVAKSLSVYGIERR